MGIIEYLAKNNLSKEQAAYSAYMDQLPCRVGDKHPLQAVGSVKRVTDSERIYSQCV